MKNGSMQAELSLDQYDGDPFDFRRDNRTIAHLFQVSNVYADDRLRFPDLSGLRVTYIYTCDSWQTQPVIFDRFLDTRYLFKRLHGALT